MGYESLKTHTPYIYIMCTYSKDKDHFKNKNVECITNLISII